MLQEHACDSFCAFHRRQVEGCYASARKIGQGLANFVCWFSSEVIAANQNETGPSQLEPLIHEG